ncbi:MAG: hypothetical protein Hyperionvirus1_197 [Hyperionvirus sp.]|uniref:Uncharacterized protein n=1 Tax=Hyperionvirus sp. TaxID=2487770 RepID=A0A3G5A613_9VIRU|nr:MAG: hypothetical protein Hyperionvirus1_197 [Hyperionvirus sp.]
MAGELKFDGKLEFSTKDDDEEIPRDPVYLECLWLNEGFKHMDSRRPVMVGGDLVVAAKKVYQRTINPMSVFTLESMFEYKMTGKWKGTYEFMRLNGGVKCVLAGKNYRMLVSFVETVSMHYIGERIGDSVIPKDSNGFNDAIVWLKDCSTESLKAAVEWYEERKNIYGGDDVVVKGTAHAEADVEDPEDFQDDEDDVFPTK